MTQPQTLEQWLADEEQKTRNLEPNEETSSISQQELIDQIKRLNLELAQEKKIRQIMEENWKKAEKEVVEKQQKIVHLTHYRNEERNDKLVKVLIILISIVIACIIHFSKQKEEEKKKQISIQT